MFNMRAKTGSIVGAMVVACGLAASSQAMVTTINYANFNDVSQLSLNGVAVQSNGLVGEQKTLSVTPPVGASKGSAWYNTAQSVNLGWVSDFQFRMRDRSGLGADGLAFVIQNASLGALGGSGGAIGFGTNDAFPVGNTGIANSVAIVFDCWDNSGNWSTIPGANVITVQTRGTLANNPSSVYSLGGVGVPGAFNDGTIHTARIAYTPGTLQIFYDNLAVPAVTVPLNLDVTLALNAGKGFVGFTAGTGSPENAQRQEVLNWQFSSVVPSPATASLLGLGGLIAVRRRRA